MQYKTLFKSGAWTLLITAGIHAISLVMAPQAANETEKQLLDLMNNYNQDMGMGIHRSTMELFRFFSMCMAFLCLFGGATNLLVLRYFDQAPGLASRFVNFNAIFWTIFLIPLFRLTFLPPEICFSVAWACFVGAWWLKRRA